MYGANCGALTNIVPAGSSSLTHSVQLSGLTAATSYSFQVVSGDGVTTFLCLPFSTVQPSLVLLTPLVVVGLVYYDSGSGCGSKTPLTTGFITVDDSRAAGSATPIMSAINSSPAGTYAAYASPASTTSQSTWFTPQSGDKILVTGDAGLGLNTVNTIWDGTTNPVVMPPLCLLAPLPTRPSRLTPTAVGPATSTPSTVPGHNSRITPTTVPVGAATFTPTPVPSRTPHPPGKFLRVKRISALRTLSWIVVHLRRGP
jgi:hypothetical protein